jgi:hypothetical protein
MKKITQSQERAIQGSDSLQCKAQSTYYPCAKGRGMLGFISKADLC